MLQDDIKRFFKGDIATDAATLDRYSTDTSIFKVRPAAVVFPKNVSDLKNLVEYVNVRKNEGENLSLTARAAGTDMTGGPLTESVVVEFTRYFNRIKQIGDGGAVVEPGVFYRDFEREADRRELFFPPYPASKHLCAMGGIVANNAAGEKTLAYGQTKKYVKELKVILSDGEEYTLGPLSRPELDRKMKLNSFEGEAYRKMYKLIEDNYDIIRKAKPDVSKNSAGYYLWDVWDRDIFDLSKLFVGSQGTLGLIAEITLRLEKKKKHSRLAVIFLRNLDPLAKLVQTVLAFNPESFESYDDKTLRLAIRFLPAMLKILKARGLISLAMQFIPEFFMVLRGGLPKLVLLVELTGETEGEAARKLRLLTDELKKLKVSFRAVRDEAEAEKYWTIRRESFNLLRERVRGKQTVPFIDDIVVRPEKLPEFLPELNKILEPYRNRMIYTVAGHVGNGNFHIIPLMNLSDPRVRAIIPELSAKVYGLVVQYGGSITAEHNDGLIRTPYLKAMYGERVYALFEETKKIFDPRNIFNPGKKVGADLAYAMSHIKTGS
ncbi:FAD-binding oxidoreductase [Candidatus Parcubacteria bacterium]|nr:MAG: FAD-binding oxidoreductase [Candidatus Parcubacteria bacterium]